MKAISIILLLQAIFWLILLWKYRNAMPEMKWQMTLNILVIIVSGLVYLDYLGIPILTSDITQISMVVCLSLASSTMFKLSLHGGVRPSVYWADASLLLGIFTVMVLCKTGLLPIKYLVIGFLIMNVLYLIAATVLFIRTMIQRGNYRLFLQDFKLRMAGLHLLIWILGFCVSIAMSLVDEKAISWVLAAYTALFAVYMFISGYQYLSHLFNRWHKPAEAVSVKTVNSSVLPETIHEIMRTEKLYTDPEFDLDMLAKRLGISVFQTSQLLNQTMKTGFYELVNSYRVEEVKRHLAANDDRHFTLLAIAFESGFNSKSTFNRIFKDFTGKTPGEFSKTFK